MDCIILCAGYGTRLKPLTKEWAKPLLKVDGLSILDHILCRLAQTPVAWRTVYVVSNDYYFAQFQRWAMGYAGRLSLELVNDGTRSEAHRLGAIGDLYYVVQRYKIADDFALINGDNLFTFSLQPMIERFGQQGTTIAAYDVKTTSAASRFGVLALAPDGRIQSFVEKPATPASTLVSTGIYFFRREVAEMLSSYQRHASSMDRTGDFLAWLIQQSAVYGYQVLEKDGKWYDIGNLSELWRAQCEIARHPLATVFPKEQQERFAGLLQSNGFTPWERQILVRLKLRDCADLLRTLNHREPACVAMAIRLIQRLSDLAALPWLLAKLDDQRIIKEGDDQQQSISAVTAQALVTLGYAQTQEAVGERAQKEGAISSQELTHVLKEE